MHLGTRHGTLETCLGASLNSKITTNQHENVENVPPSILRKRCFVLGGKSWNQKGDIPVIDLSWESVCWATKMFCHSACTFEWPQKHYKH